MVLFIASPFLIGHRDPSLLLTDGALVPRTEVGRRKMHSTSALSEYNQIELCADSQTL